MGNTTEKRRVVTLLRSCVSIFLTRRSIAVAIKEHDMRGRRGYRRRSRYVYNLHLADLFTVLPSLLSPPTIATAILFPSSFVTLVVRTIHLASRCILASILSSSDTPLVCNIGRHEASSNHLLRNVITSAIRQYLLEWS
jgi:hypothetical protein